jgi:hypothetical protein
MGMIIVVVTLVMIVLCMRIQKCDSRYALVMLAHKGDIIEGMIQK